MQRATKFLTVAMITAGSQAIELRSAGIFGDLSGGLGSLSSAVESGASGDFAAMGGDLTQGTGDLVGGDVGASISDAGG